MVDYDNKIIQQFAKSLYGQAKLIFVIYLIAGAILGLVAAVFIFGWDGLMLAFGFVIGVFVGGLFGSSKAFQYKLQAQTSLCMAQIEKNTGKK